MSASRFLLLCMIAAVTGCAERDLQVESTAERSRYPAHWWANIPRSDAADWEVLPQDAGPGAVVLSKHNELGLLSNFAHTPFQFRGLTYQSLEGFWQMMKYPEGQYDPRAGHPGVTWLYTREQVGQMVGFEAKAAGTAASENMKTLGINWVTFEGRRLTYRTPAQGEHYLLIVAATREKLRQNPEVSTILRSTGDLRLIPDHHQPLDAPPAWRYHDIAMRLRGELNQP